MNSRLSAQIILEKRSNLEKKPLSVRFPYDGH